MCYKLYFQLSSNQCKEKSIVPRFMSEVFFFFFFLSQPLWGFRGQLSQLLISPKETLSLFKSCRVIENNKNATKSLKQQLTYCKREQVYVCVCVSVYVSCTENSLNTYLIHTYAQKRKKEYVQNMFRYDFTELL